MDNLHYYCIILCGGIGSRFWPVSTIDCPKQFHDILHTGKTLIQQTFIRAKSFIRLDNIFLITHSNYKDLVLKQIPEIKKSNLLLEPFMRNTALSIAYASFKIYKIDKDAVVFISPSDHLILEEKLFFKVLNQAFQNANHNDILITLGISPTYPNSEYGYIKFCPNDSNSIKKVKSFIEKPNFETANKFFKSGNFLWNSGIFIWNIKAIIKAFKIYLPKIFNYFLNNFHIIDGDKETEIINTIFSFSKCISIDYGILEKAKNIYVIKSNFGWSDLGNWNTLYNNISKDKNNNAYIGEKILFNKSYNNMIFLKNSKVVILEDLNDYLVVDTEKVLLICKKENEKKIKNYINNLKLDCNK